MRGLRIGLAQMNSTVGDLSKNTERIKQFMVQAKDAHVDLLALPELAVTGYPPEDLLFKRQFLQDTDNCLQEIIKSTGDLAVVVGVSELSGAQTINPGVVPFPDDETAVLYNAAVVAHANELVGAHRKIFLPNYGVFDENRYFSRGKECPVFELHGITFGVNICEDIWYGIGPSIVQRLAGAGLIININGSPYHRGRGVLRQEMLSKRAKENGVYIAYVNMVGGQDELVFDGQSIVINPSGKVIARSAQFEEELLITDILLEEGNLPGPTLMYSTDDLTNIGEPVRYVMSGDRERKHHDIPTRIAAALEPLAEEYKALVTGTRDYVLKSGHKKVVVGLSGGIDSALTLTIAVDALGQESVTAVFMPSNFTSDLSYRDAEATASNLGVRFWNIDIESTIKAYAMDLEPYFQGMASGTAEENIQARIRGNLLMAISNKFGWIVLNTGNKSEMATGYCTLYGDMAGGFAVLKDVPKTLVRELAKFRNGHAVVIPSSTISREPTAELSYGQRDSDNLPSYEVLDPILEAYVEYDLTVPQMVDLGFSKTEIYQVIELVDKSEYKRRQAPPGVKITHRAFGRDRRLPIVNRYQAS